MAQAEVHYYDHRTGTRLVGHGDVWHGEFWWKTGNGSCDMNRTLMMGYDEIIHSTQMINLITIEKIVCRGKIVYQETLHKLPPLVVSLLVVLDKIERLRAAEEDHTVEGMRELEAQILKMPEALVLLSDENTANHFRKTMAAAARRSQLKAEDGAAEDIEYAIDQFDDALRDLVKFADQLCRPYVD